MTFVERKTYYFERPGEENTADAARFSIQRAQELNIRTIVVASTSGKTAQVFFDAMKGSGLQLVVVTHVVGFTKPGEWEFSHETAQSLQKQGVRIVTGTHALSGLERALSRSTKVGGGSRTEAIAEALRRVVAVGLKVAVECVLIAPDQGAIGATGGPAGACALLCATVAPPSCPFPLRARSVSG